MTDTTIGGLSSATIPIISTDLMIVSRGGSVATKATMANLYQSIPDAEGFACGDENTALAVATGVTSLAFPHGWTISKVFASVKTAPSGSAIIVNIKKNGTTILSTNLSIDSGEYTSATAATPAVVSVPSGSAGDIYTVDITQVGSSTPGSGLKVWLVGTKTFA